MRIISIQECCAGNASVGQMWLETRSFDGNTPVKEIIEWGQNVAPDSGKGKLIITVDSGHSDTGGTME